MDVDECSGNNTQCGDVEFKKNSDLHDPDADELSASLVEFS